jgi:hypothetical protein
MQQTAHIHIHTVREFTALQANLLFYFPSNIIGHVMLLNMLVHLTYEVSQGYLGLTYLPYLVFLSFYPRDERRVLFESRVSHRRDTIHRAKLRLFSTGFTDPQWTGTVKFRGGGAGTKFGPGTRNNGAGGSGGGILGWGSEWEEVFLILQVQYIYTIPSTIYTVYFSYYHSTGTCNTLINMCAQEGKSYLLHSTLMISSMLMLVVLGQ